MAAPQLASILDRQGTEIERPKPLPVGTYRAIVVGAPKFDKSTKKGTDYVEFTLKFTSAEEDVDEDDLRHALTKPSGDTIPLTEKTTRNTYYLTEDAAWRLKDFLKHCGVYDEDSSLRQMIANTQNCEVLVSLKHTPSDDGEALYANVAKTAAVS
jgi:hypothetical protein